MRLTGAITSSFFCHNEPLLSKLKTCNPSIRIPKSEHLFCRHGTLPTLYQQAAYYAKLKGNTNVDDVKLKMCRLLGRTEHFYQQNLSKITGLNHEYLPNGYITDCSNQDLLIEIKNAKNFRESYGQIMQYSLYRPTATKMLCLFGRIPHESVVQNYMELCDKADITLVWVFAEEVYLILQNETVM